MPQAAGASLILLVGLVVAKFLAQSVLIAAVNRHLAASRLLSDATRIGVAMLSIAIALEQAQIGRITVLLAFGILFGGVTLAARLRSVLPSAMSSRGGCSKGPTPLVRSGNATGSSTCSG